MKNSPTKKNSKVLLSILVPVYNEEKTLERMLDRVTSLPIDSYEVIVVNDASRDKSAIIIDAFIKKFRNPNVKIQVHTHPKNKGKGAGIQTGIKNATGEYFVIQDADLEYNPKEIPKLLEEAMRNNRPVVYGSRFLGKIEDMAGANYQANRFYNLLVRTLYRTNITDMHTCYKMVKTELIRELKMTSDGFDYAPELVSKLLKRNIEIYEIPISFKGRTKKQGKKIGYKDGVECTISLIKYRFSK
jgi:glycosyltransferase involved in cell wall biosynthesis